MATDTLLTVTRPSRTGGRPHVIRLDAETLIPADLGRPCSCAAGSSGRFCWAVLAELQERHPGSTIATTARLVADSRRLTSSQVSQSMRSQAVLNALRRES